MHSLSVHQIGATPINAFDDKPCGFNSSRRHVLIRQNLYGRKINPSPLERTSPLPNEGRLSRQAIFSRRRIILSWLFRQARASYEQLQQDKHWLN
jgi:hypothetical protein